MPSLWRRETWRRQDSARLDSEEYSRASCADDQSFFDTEACRWRRQLLPVVKVAVHKGRQEIDEKDSLANSHLAVRLRSFFGIGGGDANPGVKETDHELSYQLY